MEFWLILWLACIAIATIVGASRASPLGGFLLGLFLGPIGVLASFALVDNKCRACPFCKELISRGAVKCPRCQSDLSPGQASSGIAATGIHARGPGA